jgi:hypothetical protein
VLKLLSGSEWKAEVVKKHQKIQDECNANNQPNKTDQLGHPFVQGQEKLLINLIWKKNFTVVNFSSKLKTA